MKRRWLKLATVVLPIFFLAASTWAALFVFRGFFESPIGFGLSLVVDALAVIAFSQVVFGLFEKLEGQVREQNRQLGALARIATGSAERAELTDLLTTALTDVLDVIGADAGAICLLDANGRSAKLRPRPSFRAASRASVV